MKRHFIFIILLVLFSCAAAGGEECVEALTYAVFPYVPDIEYYQALIEAQWAELEPNINLVRAKWNCYYSGAPDGIDVIMYDAVTRDRLIANGWVQPVRRSAIWEPEDIFPFSLEGLTVEGDLYGIPVFLCGNFLIYDQGCELLVRAGQITDLADEAGFLVVNSEDRSNRSQYIIEAIADARGAANPSVDESAEDIMSLIDRLAIDAHRGDSDAQVAMAYDAGTGQGYIGFSESMSLLSNRLEQTRIKSISFSDRKNTLRLYADAVAVTAGPRGQRYEKCLELMNVMAEAGVLTALSVQEGAPQYLMLARRAPYRLLADRFPIYGQLEALASDEANHVILTP